MLNRYTYYLLSIITIINLVGCQTTSPPKPSVKKPIEKLETHKPDLPKHDGIKIIPYDRPEIKREHLPVIVPEHPKAPSSTLDDGANVPAVKQLLQQTQTLFQKGQWDQAEHTALHAQRLAPQSAETFLYLARIANQKQQYANAESLSRRGLAFAQSTSQKKLFWNVILQSAQQQKNQKTVAEALSHLKDL